jgi:two-component system, response regulator PdtaR
LRALAHFSRQVNQLLMVDTLRIIVADDDSDTRSLLSRLLSRLGHQIVASVGDGNALVEECLAHRPDLVISDIRMPLRDGLSAASHLCQTAPVPVILVTAHMDQALVQRACESDIMAYLIKPVNEPEVEAAIALAMTRFGECSKLRQEAKDLRQALDDRKVIERAKGILMKRASLDEQAAFRRLQKLASARNMRLAELAQRVCDAEEAVDWSD